jgi:hypothetical protein
MKNSTTKFTKWFVITVLLAQTILYAQNRENAYDSFKITGNIKDSKSNTVVAHADLYLLNCNKSVVANEDGSFQFSVPKISFNDKLIISALGYYSDTILVSELEKLKNKTLEIELKKENNAEVSLDDKIVVSSKKKSKALSAKAILTKARENLGDNYYQKPFNQRFFFRAQTARDGLFVVNEEASLSTFSANGIKVSDDPVKNYFGEIEQFRKNENSQDTDNWKGVGYFGVVVFRNILLSNQNVLYETNAFELKKEGTTIYNGKRVYVIRFTNLDPDVFSTGFGNPEANTANGFIYIETESFAVVKFEQYVILKDERSNDNDDITIQSSLKITQTYKNVNGKYFINYCNEKVESSYFSIKDKKQLYFINSVYDLMSEDIKTEELVAIKRPIDRLKLGVKLKEDPEYWKNSNLMPENKKMEF